MKVVIDVNCIGRYLVMLHDELLTFEEKNEFVGKLQEIFAHSMRDDRMAKFNLIECFIDFFYDIQNLEFRGKSLES